MGSLLAEAAAVVDNLDLRNAILSAFNRGGE